MDFDAVMVLGKELRKDPVRGRAELWARSAAAAVAWRQGVSTVLALEAQLKGQTEAGSDIVAQRLREHGVPDSALVLDTSTRSTREEALEARRHCEEQRWSSLLVITSAYHLPRARRCFEDVFDDLSVTLWAPEDLLPSAHPMAREDILAAETPQDALRKERRAERVLLALERLLEPLPSRVRWGLEVRAGAWLRGLS